MKPAPVTASTNAPPQQIASGDVPSSTLSGSEVDEITFFADPALPSRFGLPERI